MSIEEVKKDVIEHDEALTMSYRQMIYYLSHSKTSSYYDSNKLLIESGIEEGWAWRENWRFRRVKESIRWTNLWPRKAPGDYRVGDKCQ